MAALNEVAQEEVRRVIVRRFAEPLQEDAEAMVTMRRIGAMPQLVQPCKCSSGTYCNARRSVVATCSGVSTTFDATSMAPTARVVVLRARFHNA